MLQEAKYYVYPATIQEKIKAKIRKFQLQIGSKGTNEGSLKLNTVIASVGLKSTAKHDSLRVDYIILGHQTHLSNIRDLSDSPYTILFDKVSLWLQCYQNIFLGVSLLDGSKDIVPL